MAAISLIAAAVAIVLLGLVTRFGFKIRFGPLRSKFFIAVVTYVISLLTVGSIAFVLVMVIAGPHSGIVEPGMYSQIIYVTGLSCILVIPVVAAYLALRRASSVRT